MAIAALVMLVGVIQLRNAPMGAVPEFSPAYVEVQTEALGLSAVEVEQLITVPLEQDLLNGVAWLDEIHSESVTGLSSIQMLFEPGTDLLRARQMVQERLTQAHALPNVSKPPVMLQPLSSTSRVMMIGLSSSELSLIDLSVLARWRIKPRLMGIPGVANVAVWGHREQQLQVEVDPARLREHGVSLTDVMETAGNALWVSPLSFVEASTPGTGGFIDTPSQRLSIQHISPIVTARDLARVAVQDTDGGEILRLGDITDVVEDHQPLIGDALVDDGPGLILVVEKLPWGNTAEVTRQLEAALESMRPGLAGVEIDTTVFRPASFLESARANLGTAVLMGLALLVLALGALLMSWRALVIGLAAISLSLLAAGLVLQLRGATFNSVVVAGLVAALCVVIDDAIVGVAGLRRPPHQGRPDLVSTARAFLEVRGPLGYATLISAVAILPGFVVAGVVGAFLRPLAVSYLLAILVSTLVALTVTPALALLLSPTGAGREGPLARWLQRRYDAFFGRVTDRPHTVLAITGLLTTAGVALLPLLGTSMLPALEDRDLLVKWDGPPGTSRAEMSRITELVGSELRSLPGIRGVGAQVGRAITSDQVVNVNSGEVWVSIDPAADYDATLGSVRQVVSGYPGLDSDVITYPEDRIEARTAAADHDLVIRVFGPDFDVLAGKAGEIRAALGAVDGIAGARVESQPLEPTVEIEVDLAAAHRYGIKPGDVRRAAATMVSGVTVGYLFEEQKVFEVVVWGAPATRQSLTSLRGLELATPEDEYIRLGDVADVRLRPVPNVIEHDAVSRRVDVLADVRGRDVGAVIADVNRMINSVEFPVEYHAEVLDIGAPQRAEQRQLLVYAGAALVGVYLLLQAAFGSWRLAGAAMAILPIPLVGGLVAGFLSDREISLGVVAGLYAVLAIAVRNCVLLISRYQRVEQQGGGTRVELVRAVTRDRLVPILTTAAAVAVALLPLVLLGDRAGFEIVRPMAVVVLGGLVTSTVLSVVLLPLLYLRFAPTSAERTPDAPP